MTGVCSIGSDLVGSPGKFGRLVCRLFYPERLLLRSVLPTCLHVDASDVMQYHIVRIPVRTQLSSRRLAALGAYADFVMWPVDCCNVPLMRSVAVFDWKGENVCIVLATSKQASELDFSRI
jgi:hypothetical protein